MLCRCQASIMQIYQRDTSKEIFVKTHEAAKRSKGEESGDASSTDSGAALPVAATTAEFVMLISTVLLV